MRIMNNIMALNAHRQLMVNQGGVSKSIERLSSGLRINRAGDDAAGLAISEKMRGQIRGLNQAVRNAQDGISLIQTAEGALNETHAILQRMRELADQAASDTNTDIDRNEIQKEINELTSELNRIGNTTEFNTMKLLDGSRANTYAIDGVQFQGGVANVNAGGMTLTLNPDNGLAAGDYTLDVTTTRETRADYQVALAFGEATFTINGSGTENATFENDSITVDSSDIFHTNDPEWTIEVVDAATGELRITNDETAGSPYSADRTFFVGEEFNEYGFTFTITDLGDMKDGDTITFATEDSVTTSIGTALTGWDAAPVDPGEDAPTWTTALTVTDAAQAGEYTITFDTGNSAITVELDGVILDTIAIADAYDYHGIQFELDNVNDLKDGSTITFTVEETFKVEASLNGGTAVELVSGWDGTSDVVLDEFTDGDLAGLVLNSEAALADGSYDFTVEDSESGADNSLALQIGANEGQAMRVSIADLRAEALGISSSSGGAGFSSNQAVTNGTDADGVEYGLDMSSHETAAAAITTIDNAIEAVSAERSKLGAMQNRLEHTIANLGASAENLQAAESRIRDVDMAAEMMAFTKFQILQQASTAMLAQANLAPQSVLQLLG